MNTEALRNTRELMARHLESYSQATWMHDPDCRTPACVAGFAAVANGAIGFRPPARNAHSPWHEFEPTCRNPATGLRSTVSECAIDVLGLTPIQARDMFTATPVSDRGTLIERPTGDQALTMLDRAIEDDEIAWPCQLLAPNEAIR